MTARQLITLIASRHTNDLFVPECKDGATIFGSHFRLDAWAMKRSWVKPVSTGYEVKVSRSDFLRDNKIPAYIDLCNELYLVAPSGVVNPEELPEGCGLLVPASTGSRLFIKRKAAYREIEEPALLYKYILMSRAIIDSKQRWIESKSRREYWLEWAERRQFNRDFGNNLRGVLRRVVDRQITEVAKENDQLRGENNRLSDVRVMLERLGIDTDGWTTTYRVERRLEDIRRAIPEKLDRKLRSVETEAARLSESIKELREQLGEKAPVQEEMYASH